MRAIHCLIPLFLMALDSSAAFADACRIEKQATLPITFNRFVPTVPVTINGRTINMGIDTGSEKTFVTPQTAMQLGLPRDTAPSTMAIGAGSETLVHKVILDDLEFAGSSYREKSVSVISMQSKGSEAPVAGLIGADILSNYDIDFDVPGHTLTLYKVSGCSKISPPWHGAFVEVPVSLTSTRRFVMPIVINQHKITAIFDTGSNGMRLTRKAALQTGLTEAMLAADPQHDGYGIGDHVYQISTHRFESVVIARETFHNPRIDVADITIHDADMLVGENYMHARRFWLSYATGVILIQRVIGPTH